MDPQIRKRPHAEAIKRLLVRESLNQPLILIVEGSALGGYETQAFLMILSESIATGAHPVSGELPARVSA